MAERFPSALIRQGEGCGDSELPPRAERDSQPCELLVDSLSHYAAKHFRSIGCATIPRHLPPGGAEDDSGACGAAGLRLLDGREIGTSSVSGKAAASPVDGNCGVRGQTNRITRRAGGLPSARPEVGDRRDVHGRAVLRPLFNTLCSHFLTVVFLTQPLVLFLGSTSPCIPVSIPAVPIAMAPDWRREVNSTPPMSFERDCPVSRRPGGRLSRKNLIRSATGAAPSRAPAPTSRSSPEPGWSRKHMTATRRDVF